MAKSPVPSNDVKPVELPEAPVAFDDDAPPIETGDPNPLAGRPKAGPSAEKDPPADPPAGPQQSMDPGRDDIVSLFRKQRDAEEAAAAAEKAGKQIDQDPEEPAAGEAPAAEASTETGVAPAEPQVTRSANEPPEDPEIELVIHGQQVKKPLSEVIALAQQAGASNNLLEETKSLLREAKQIRERAAQGDPDPVNQPDDPTAPVQPDPSRADPPSVNQLAEIEPEKLREFAERTQVGDAENDAAAFAEFA